MKITAGAYDEKRFDCPSCGSGWQSEWWHDCVNVCASCA